MRKKRDYTTEIERLQAKIEGLEQAIDRLKTLNTLAQQIGAAESLEKINLTLIRQSVQMINAEQGVVTLIEKDNLMETLFRTRLSKNDITQLAQIYRPHPLVPAWMAIHKKPLRIRVPEDQVEGLDIQWHAAIRSFMCVPLLTKNRLIGLLSLFNKKNAREFSRSDEQLLSIIAMQSAQVLENQRLVEERNRVKLIFGQHVSPAMVDEILKAGTEIVSRRLPMSVLFMDIRGFSTFAEKRRPEEVMAYLNRLFDFLIVCVLEHKGIIHRLLGDSFVALFGAPISQGNDAQNAVRAGLSMLQRLEEKCASGYIPPTRIGIGIHAGDVVVGMIGSADRKEYQINGDVVNVAARIEQLNKQFNAQMLISDTIWRAIDQRCHPAESLGEVEVKGREERVHVYKLA